MAYCPLAFAVSHRALNLSQLNTALSFGYLIERGV